MIYATHPQTGEKILATPSTRARCPGCEGEVYSRCPEGGRVWHWAHMPSNTPCLDKLSDGMTPWHVWWQSLLRPEFVEVRIGKLLRADIFTPNHVIELQHSTISREDVALRNEAYGADRIVWLFDGNGNSHNWHFDRFASDQCEDEDDDEKVPLERDIQYRWNYGRQELGLATEGASVYVDFSTSGRERLQIFQVKSRYELARGYRGKGQLMGLTSFANQYLWPYMTPHGRKHFLTRCEELKRMEPGTITNDFEFGREVLGAQERQYHADTIKRQVGEALSRAELHLLFHPRKP